MNPAAIAGWDQGVIAPNLLEGLFRLSPDGREIEPAIAESFEVSEDGKTWTFNLRAGAKFHNGREITADDFKYSFERVLNPETRSPKAWMLSIIVGAEAFQDGSADEVSGIRVVDAGIAGNQAGRTAGSVQGNAGQHQPGRRSAGRGRKVG